MCWCRADLSTNRNAHVLEALFPATPQFEEVAKNGVTKKGIFFRVHFQFSPEDMAPRYEYKASKGVGKCEKKSGGLWGGTFYILDILSGTKPNA